MISAFTELLKKAIIIADKAMMEKYRVLWEYIRLPGKS